MTISVPTEANLCHNSLWFNRRLGALTDADADGGTSSAAESDAVSSPTVPTAAVAGICDGVP